jgi:hypothetical protein
MAPALVCALVLPAGHALADDASDATIVVRWNQAVLQAIRDTRMPPPQVARALAIVHTSMYDAWAAYDDRAVGTRLGDRLRRPELERTDWHEAAAVSHAAYRAAVDLFPSRQQAIFRPLMDALGYVPDPTNLDLSTPAGVGNQAAAAVIAFRHSDGSNQRGDLSPGGVPYADYTGYVPVNDPWTLNDPNRWQPLLQPDGQPQQFLSPHWGRVVPFALTSPSQFRPKPPASFGSAAYRRQAAELVALSAALDDRMKAIAVYWADGPATETPPGHWMLIAQSVSARDAHTLDDDVTLFFVLGTALLDASIAAWDCKVAFDSIRPESAIRWFFAGRQLAAWAGPGRGAEIIDGSAWRSYIPTPPFAEHVSGHSTFSAAAAEVLRRFTGRDTMDMAVTVRAGSSPVEPGFAPASDVTLTWRTFSDAADQAGASRRLGGIHFRDADLEGRRLGRRVGAQAWRVAVGYLHGACLAGEAVGRRPGHVGRRPSCQRKQGTISAE